jgi:hypothetical protein
MGDNFRLRDIWYRGVIFVASMADLIHAQEFLLEQLERSVKGSEEPMQPVIDEFEMNDPCP